MKIDIPFLLAENIFFSFLSQFYVLLSWRRSVNHCKGSRSSTHWAAAPAPAWVLSSSNVSSIRGAFSVSLREATRSTNYVVTSSSMPSSIWFTDRFLFFDIFARRMASMHSSDRLVAHMLRLSSMSFSAAQIALRLEMTKPNTRSQPL